MWTPNRSTYGSARIFGYFDPGTQRIIKVHSNFQNGTTENATEQNRSRNYGISLE